MILRISDLAVSFGSRRVLDGVSCGVERGQAVALMGPNGAGKTTLLRCILGLVRYEGRIVVDGLDAATAGPEARARIGYVPQAPAFYDLTAGDFLRFVARLRRTSTDAVPGLLRRVGLEAEADRPVRVFSGGMQQRLSLGAALLGDPPIVLLDEPTANLDPAGREELLRLLREFRSEGKTLLLSSHRAGEVRGLADRVLLLKEGRVEAYGRPEETMLAHGLEVDVEARDSREKARLGELLAPLGVFPAPSSNGSLHLLLDPGLIVAVLDLLRSSDVAAGRIRVWPRDDGGTVE